MFAVLPGPGLQTDQLGREAFVVDVFEPSRAQHRMPGLISNRVVFGKDAALGMPRQPTTSMIVGNRSTSVIGVRTRRA